MDIRRLAEAAAEGLGESVATLMAQGDLLRGQRHSGWLAAEPWLVDPQTGLASLIDHTILKPEATSCAVERLCAEAEQYGFRAVCVNPALVGDAARALQGTQVRVATVIGFPLGAATTLVKAVEATDCVARGARELDMVIHIGALKERRLRQVLGDIRAVAETAGSNALVKVILETGLLDDEEKVLGGLLCQWAGADYVKTSTGFGPSGATTHDVAMLRTVVKDRLGVKAAGGIRDAATARAMVVAGASRIGTSGGPAIARQA